MNNPYRVQFNIIVDASSHAEATLMAIAQLQPGVKNLHDVWTTELNPEDGEDVSTSMFNGETLREM